MKEKGARVIIGEFFEDSARHIMCNAYKMGMTQKEGYVWFLPGWFSELWYDLDAKRSNDQVITSEFIQDKLKHKKLPNCTTQQMLSALSGHLTLTHVNIAEDHNIIPDGRTIGQWRHDLQMYLNATHHNSSFVTESLLDKNIGYVYDAVTLYGIALHKMLNQTKESYVQNLHSERTINAFVKIINATDFNGVSGRINFKGRPSRLSNIMILQSHLRGSGLVKVRIGLYQPNYEEDGNTNSVDDEHIGRMIEWNKWNIKWETENGEKPTDKPVECGVLSGFATHLEISCQLAITYVFLIILAVIFLNLLLVLLYQKRR